MPRPFRFLHAADLHLGQPVRGVTDTVEPLVDLLIDCPLHAAARVFDAAINQRVDFVVLAGDVINPRNCAPREWLFLVEQFQRLAQHNIPVYWSGGATDSLDQWPSYICWPGNVRIFPRGRADHLRHEIAGVPVCEIVGRGHDESGPPRPYEFTPTNGQLFSIAVAHADWNAGALGEIGVNYWALGGAHQRSTPLESLCVAHVAGSPQGRCPSETGPNGCTLVTVDESSQIRLTPINCDVARWTLPRLLLPEAADQHELEKLLRARTEQWCAEALDVHWLITWTVACGGALRSLLRNDAFTAELILKLRNEFTGRAARVWTVGIDLELPEQMPPVRPEDETLRGEFLRAVQALDSDPGTFGVGGLDAQLAPDDFPAAFVERLNDCTVSIDQTIFDRQMLREVAWLGADLLGPAEEAL